MLSESAAMQEWSGDRTQKGGHKTGEGWEGRKLRELGAAEGKGSSAELYATDAFGGSRVKFLKRPKPQDSSGQGYELSRLFDSSLT